eukprot:gnl/MRDRNA2_/MRDRNA2_110966_c0_seq1.p1 gnl/MRDRNA2_/MRDRNA2_110966_c0~~gnl/MRDRNA2_/MRDRNA2_110966_c0_seq1.p1  ORF type:complete len:209 (-),score=63.82 gnl/MRDRNA2_/MRDRNA2_110966_c0_seq1:119-745(-)
MTAISLDLHQWLQQPHEWKWDTEKEDAKEEDDWAKAFANVKGDNPFELAVSAMMAIGAVLNGNEHHQDGEKVEKAPGKVASHVEPEAETVHEAEIVHEPEAEMEPKAETLQLPMPMKEPFPAIQEDCNSPSRQLLNKMLGMSTLSFSKLPAEADSDLVPTPHSTPLKRQRTVSFSELPEIHHVESFKDMVELWDPAYLSPQRLAQTVP